MPTPATTPRPLIDPMPEKPLTFHGFRIGRDGNVYATTKPVTHGRSNPNYEIVIGTIEKRGRIWKAFSKGGLEFLGERQRDAANELYTWYQAREQAHGGTDRAATAMARVEVKAAAEEADPDNWTNDPQARFDEDGRIR